MGFSKNKSFDERSSQLPIRRWMPDRRLLHVATLFITTFITATLIAAFIPKLVRDGVFKNPANTTENRLERTAKRLHTADSRNSNQGGNEAVLNGRSSSLALQQESNNASHEDLHLAALRRVFDGGISKEKHE